MARFYAQAGADEGEVYSLESDAVGLGRNPENQIVVNDSAASRFHARIVRRDGNYFVQDLNSTHGTFVNGVRNNGELLLGEGDIVQIGNTELVFQSASEPIAPLPSDNTPIHSFGSQTIAFSMPVGPKAVEDAAPAQHVEVLSKIATTMQSVLDLDDLLRALMDMTFDVLKPERGVILLFEADSSLRARVRRPADDDLQVSQTVVTSAIEQRVSLLISDMQMDDRFSGAHSIMAQAIRSAICSPLVSKDKVLGVLYLDTQSHRLTYSKQDLAVLNLIAANAAIAIENAMLIQQKVEAERLAAVGVAIAGISHYVKNILAGVIGSSSLIEQGIATDKFDIVKKIWPVLKRSNEKISQLVQDMLTYSKRREPEWEEGNINTLLLDVFEGQSQRAQDSKVELSLDLEEEMPNSMFETKSIHDTVLNIVGNAVEASANLEGAQVSLHSQYDKSRAEICIWISDNGPGIPPDIQKRIFEPFFSTKGSKGTGLGLAVARKSVEEHGGKLLLESIPGQGATFRIFLPKDMPLPATSLKGPDETKA